MQTADIYACRNCDHTQFSEDRVQECEKCGGVLTKVEGVQITIGKEDVRKYAHELSRESGYHSH